MLNIAWKLENIVDDVGRSRSFARRSNEFAEKSRGQRPDQPAVGVQDNACLNIALLPLPMNYSEEMMEAYSIFRMNNTGRIFFPRQQVSVLSKVLFHEKLNMHLWAVCSVITASLSQESSNRSSVSFLTRY